MITMCTVTITFNSGKQKDTLRGPETLYYTVVSLRGRSIWLLFAAVEGVSGCKTAVFFNCKKMYIWIMNLFQ